MRNCLLPDAYSNNAVFFVYVYFELILRILFWKFLLLDGFVYCEFVFDCV